MSPGRRHALRCCLAAPLLLVAACAAHPDRFYALTPLPEPRGRAGG